MTRCCGSTVFADRIFDGKAVCTSCYQLVPVIPSDGAHRLGEHSRPVAVDTQEDRMWTPDERSAA